MDKKKNIKKRVKIKLNHPNPLFEKWLTEWLEEAKVKNLKTQYVLQNALKSLKKYPMPFATGKDCMILNGFGKKICMMLDKKLQKHNQIEAISSSNSSNDTIIYDYQALVHNVNDFANDDFDGASGTDGINAFKPEYQSEPFAILISLLKNSGENGLSKSDITKNGQLLCKDKIKCTGSIKDLLEHQYIRKQLKPSRYFLTDIGRTVAENVFKEHEQQINVCLKQQNCIEIKSTSAAKMKGTSLSQPEHETYIFPPQSFDIYLIIDNQETSGSRNSKDDEIVCGTRNSGILFEVRHLKIGDYAFICKDKTSTKELVLPYIIERKRLDDFGHSIKDGRFHEQKFRLKNCGIPNVIYLIEQFNTTHTGLPITTLLQAATNTLIQDGFSVKFTKDTHGTIEYLSTLYTLLNSIYLKKTLVSCPKDTLTKFDIWNDLISLMNFEEFNKNSSKTKTATVTDMFVKHLLQIKGLSIDKAMAIVEKFPTPKLLQNQLQERGQEGEKLIADIKYGTLNKNIGPAIGRILYQLYTKDVF